MDLKEKYDALYVSWEERGEVIRQLLEGEDMPQIQIFSGDIDSEITIHGVPEEEFNRWVTITNSKVGKLKTGEYITFRIKYTEITLFKTR